MKNNPREKNNARVTLMKEKQTKNKLKWIIKKQQLNFAFDRKTKYEAQQSSSNNDSLHNKKKKNTKWKINKWERINEWMNELVNEWMNV